jgi:hypothetical protein
MSDGGAEKSSFTAPVYKARHDGLDFTNLDHTTAEEIAVFKEATSYAAPAGQPGGHAGLAWWLDQGSDYAASVLKRYRLFVHSTFNEDRSGLIAKSPSMMALYSLMNYESGLGYVMRRLPRQATREQALEMVAIAFVYCGPAGMERIANVWRTLEWPEAPTDPAIYPAGWGPDPDAFKSGLDFSSAGLSKDEIGQLEAWYLRHLGEVPPYISLLVEFSPQVLKDYRNRFENLARSVPKQVVPTSWLHFNVQTRCAAGIRENVLLARSFGVSRDYVLALVQNGAVYGSVDAIAQVEQEAGDVLRAWDPPPGK